MSMNKLMEFRTVFLRSIAEAWFDGEFRTALLHHAETALKDKFGFQWPWGHMCTLQILNSDGQFEWLDKEWVYSSALQEALILRVPLEPRLRDGRLIPARQRAMALGDYYRQHASLFSDDWGQLPGGSPRVRPSALPVIGSDSPAPEGGFMPADDEFTSFKVALLAALAKAWEDESFRKMLTIDSAAALHTIRDYQLPWNMRVRIEDSKQLYWAGPEESPTPGWFNRDAVHELHLFLPDTPKDSVQPLALAMYNATGAEFPFTCTC